VVHRKTEGKLLLRQEGTGCGWAQATKTIKEACRNSQSGKAELRKAHRGTATDRSHASPARLHASLPCTNQTDSGLWRRREPSPGSCPEKLHAKPGSEGGWRRTTWPLENAMRLVNPGILTYHSACRSCLVLVLTFASPAGQICPSEHPTNSSNNDCDFQLLTCRRVLRDSSCGTYGPRPGPSLLPFGETTTEYLKTVVQVYFPDANYSGDSGFFRLSPCACVAQHSSRGGATQ
jgi:hypothetical protein